MNNKAHLRPKDYDSNGDIIPTACKESEKGELAEKLKDRIEENICKRCPMNNNCVLCEISRVFQIITLTMEEQKGGVENGN